MAAGYPKFRNDGAVAEIRIGAREFNCIGMLPPHDHPHVYLDMGDPRSDPDVIRCPYCWTRYRWDPRLAPVAADPPDCLFIEPGGT